MNPVNHTDGYGDAKSDPHHPIFEEAGTTIFREPQRELDNRIRQLFLLCPPFPDERVDAKHHKHHNQEKESPEHQRLCPDCKVMACIEGGFSFIKPL